MLLAIARKKDMAQRQRPIRPSETANYLKAIKTSGFKCARLIAHPDGRLEIIGEDRPQDSEHEQPSKSPFEQWEMEHANTS
ncbi:transcription factor iiib 50 kda subunit [Roseibium sp. TrichSKD4]|nr:transcription factor iiib 50 kda subunit [Roseibium sp. TrichSKD4]